MTKGKGSRRRMKKGRAKITLQDLGRAKISLLLEEEREEKRGYEAITLGGESLRSGFRYFIVLWQNVACYPFCHLI